MPLPPYAAAVRDRSLLRNFTGSAVAFSLRRLSASFSGPVVQVRRSSDSAEATFTAEQIADGTLLAWVGSGNGFVKTWYDQSGNGNNATQTTATQQPQIVSSGAMITDGGVPALRFVQSPQTQMDFTAISAGSVFMVAKSNAGGAIQYSFSGSARGVGFGAAQGYAAFMFQSSLTSAGTYADGMRAVIGAFSAATTKTVWMNSSSGTGTTASLTSISRIGNRTDINLGHNGTIQEILAWTGDVISSRAAIFSNLNSYYSVF